MKKSTNVRVAVSWLLVGVPLGYGVFQTLSRAAALFG
ncbi:MFS transporter small subunit [Arthrobacter sp. G119Y2]